MDRNLRWRSIGLIALIITCIATLLPTFVGSDRLPSWFHKKKINMGLDLRGGLHIIYGIDLDRAVDDKASEIKRDLDAKFGEGEWKDKITVVTPSSPVGAVTIKVTDVAKKGEVENLVMADYKDVAAKRECRPDDGPTAICIQVSSSYAEGIRVNALKNAVLTIRERIDERGIAEPSVQEKGEDIIVELPGVVDDKDDPEASESVNRVRALIARTAKLEFKIADDGSAYMKNLFTFAKSDPNAAAEEISADPDSWTVEDSPVRHNDWYLFARDQKRSIPVAEAKKIGCWTKDLEVTEGKVWCQLTGKTIIERYLFGSPLADIKGVLNTEPKLKLPDGRQIAFELVNPDPSAKDKRPYWRTWYLDRAVRLSGSAVTQAQTSWDQNTNKPIVQVDFNRYGGRVFGDLTSQNVGKRMAIILDDKVNSAPTINGPIRGGHCQITMGGSDAAHMQSEADDLVSVLKTGSLPAPLREESVRAVGPTLGADAIDKAKISFAVGILLVIIIMLGIYRWSGWVAIGAVTINVMMMLTAMTWFGATLTLPGIAALVLTVGMGVDGNILIYERIRDELTLGKSVRGAVDVGFSRAFTAILDGHVTTAAGGWVLLQYGSGPIKGFAVMLLVGIFCTLICSTVVTRIFFDWVSSRHKGANATTLSI
ncbi:MAG: protein translocase subunit SecD [Deltaproteobacteria bacterium]|nr:protein translocase subunit SecD [Deltaproteobacteria bacterium]